MTWVIVACWAVIVLALGLRLWSVTARGRELATRVGRCELALDTAAHYRETHSPHLWDGKGPGESCLLLITDGNVRTWVDCHWDSGEIEGPGGERARVAPYYVTPWGEDATRVGRITHWARHPDHEHRVFLRRNRRAA